MAQVTCTEFELEAPWMNIEDGCAKKDQLRNDGPFVAVNIGKFSHHHHQQILMANEKECNTSPRLSVVKSLSRKGSLRNGEMSNNSKDKAEITAVTSPEERDTNNTTGNRPADGTEKSPLVIHVAVDKEIVDSPHAVTPTRTSSGGGTRTRRMINGRRSVWLPWLDPARRVLLLFATLSSMGTLLLLYFTLCMDKNMPDGDSSAR